MADQDVIVSARDKRERLMRLSGMLADGASIDAAIAACSHEAVSLEALKSEIDEILRSPALGLARVLSVRLRAAYWWQAALATLQEAGGAPEVHVLDGISRDDFFERYYYRNRPVLLRRVARDWPALRRWTREHLVAACGDACVEVMMNRNSAARSQQSVAPVLRQTLPFSRYVDMVYEGGSGNDVYLVARNQFFDRVETRTLLDDLGPLPFVETDARRGDVRLWFGPAGTVTPLHQDSRNIVMVQVVGRKNVRLYAPYYGAAMRQVQLWYAATDPAHAPGDAAGSRATPRLLRLEPGDALFLPVGWWHEVESLTVSMTLSCFDFGVPNMFDDPMPLQSMETIPPTP